MTPNLWFWTIALANLGVIVACGARGVRAIRSGDARTHRRMMLTAVALVGLFLLSYLAKVAWLGHEDRSAWTRIDYAVLYVHELCIAGLLVAGGIALYRGLRFQRVLRPTWVVPAGADALPGRASHRRAGRVAAWAGVFAFLTAIGVWIGMLVRAQS